MTAARLQERIDLSRRLNDLLRLRRADPGMASWCDEEISEIEASLRQKEGQA